MPLEAIFTDLFLQHITKVKIVKNQLYLGWSTHCIIV